MNGLKSIPIPSTHNAGTYLAFNSHRTPTHLFTTVRQEDGSRNTQGNAKEAEQSLAVYNVPFHMKKAFQKLDFPPESVSPIPRHIPFSFCYKDE